MTWIDLKTPISNIVVATDASSYGGGLAYAKLPPDLFETFFHSRISKGWYINIKNNVSPVVKASKKLYDFCDNTSWKYGISNKWKFSGHINILEAIALLNGLRWLTRSPQHIGTRVPFLIDSLVLCGALAKGHWSSRKLLHQVR